jgi:hypothetical protein
MLAEAFLSFSKDFEQSLKEVMKEVEGNKAECMIWEDPNGDNMVETRKV